MTIPNSQTVVTLDDVSFSAIPASAFASSTTVPTEITSGQQANTPYSGLYYSNTGSRSAYLQDLGSTTGAVSTQANFVSQETALTSAAPPALTSSQVATANANTQTASYVQADAQSIATLANALKVAYNLLQADLVAIRANDVLQQADLANTRTVLNAELTALQTAGGPQKSS